MAAVTVGASVAFQGFPISGCAPTVDGLSISVPASIETRDLNAGESVIIDMGAATVTDTRGNGPSASWTVSTICSGLSAGPGKSLGAQYFAYSLNSLTKTGGLTLTAHELTSMSALAIILEATSGEGTNSATWIPVITISVPESQFAGTYKGSITHSVY
jgi:hypothetical protein